MHPNPLGGSSPGHSLLHERYRPAGLRSEISRPQGLAAHLFDNSELRGSFRVRVSRASRPYCAPAFPDPSVVEAELMRLARWFLPSPFGKGVLLLGIFAPAGTLA